MSLSIIINQNLLPILCSHLNPVDLLSLKLTCKIFKANGIDKIFYSKVMNNFWNYIIKNNLEHAVKFAFNQHNGLFSGSLVLSCLLGEHYDNSDVDVWISNREYNEMIYHGGYTNMPHTMIRRHMNNLGFIEKYTQRRMPYHLTRKIDREEDWWDIARVHEYQKDEGVTFQYIFIKNGRNVLDHIQNKFDYRVCGNVIDKNLLIVNNIDDLINKRLTYNPKGIFHDTHRLKYRLNKYLSRGFKFDTSKEQFDMLLSIEFGDIIIRQLKSFENFSHEKCEEIFLDMFGNENMSLKVNVLKDIFGDKIYCYCPGIKKLEKIPKIYVVWTPNSDENCIAKTDNSIGVF